jgi:phenylalanyl-tRNA synthetase alpha chain
MADDLERNKTRVLQHIREHGRAEFGAIADDLQIDQSQVAAAAMEAETQGLVRITEWEREELVRTDGAMQLFGKLPEQLAADMLICEGGEMPMALFAAWAKSQNLAVNEVLKWGGARGWIARQKKNNETAIVLTNEGKRTALRQGKPLEDHIALTSLDYTKRVFLDELDAKGRDVNLIRSLLSNRPELAKIKKRTQRIIEATDALKSAQIDGNRLVTKNTLTPEDLESGAWREISLRPYDVTLAARDVYPAKIHPLRKIIEQTRRAFLEMGFTEVASPMIESAFWNFDALFQPQDHPARDMQDTFYMRDPAEAPLPSEWHGLQSVASQRFGRTEVRATSPDIVENVRRTHEDGWETGSEGWGYTWSPERSKQVVLRTHTTAATIRALAACPNPPGKFFCVGWTYRNETISFKHLPVFHQVDGIVVDEEANLASLMGTLQEFYSKMGFGRVKFKPAFYPYTEPSVDVVVYMESRKKWLEMGGAGIFRPEVTLPLGCNWPVLAWGLGIERLAMLRFGLSDIRELYGTNLDALQQVPLCR